MAKREKTSINHKAASSQKTNSPYILIVEDEPTHAVIIRHAIQSADSNAVVKVVESLKAYRNAIANSLPAIVLIDYYLPDGNPFDVMTLPPENGLFPFVVMTNSGDEKLAVKAIKAGALDYIAKTSESFQLVPHTIEHALREWKILIERKQAEEALKESEENFRSVAENLHDVFFITDAKGNITYISPAVNLVFGYKMEEMKDHFFGEYLDESELPRILPIFENAIRTGIPSKNLELRAKRSDGTIISAELSTSIVVSHGKVKGTAGVIRDITERMRAEESVREIVNNAPFGAHLYELESNQRLVFIGANRSADSILGVNNQEFIGKTIEEAFPLLSKTDIPDAYRRVAAAGERYEMEQVDYTEGTIRGVYEVHAFQTGINRMATFFRDISERRRAEELLKHSETKYRLLADHMKDTVWLMDMNLKTTYISPSVERLRGFTLEELQQLPLDRQFTPASYQLAMEAFSEEMEKVTADQNHNITRSLDLEFYRKDGTTYWSESLFTLIRDENGVPLSIMGEGRDITERKRIEEELFKSKMLLNETEKTGKIGGWEFDVKTMIQTWTEETFNILEVDLTKGSPKVPEGIDFITPAFRPMAAQAIQKAIECGEPYDQEWEVITAKGNKRWVHSVARVHQEHGKTIRISGSFQDITERKRVEEELKESEEKYQSLFNQSIEGVYLHDFEGRIIDVNNKVCLQSGYTREEMLQRNIFDCHPSRLSTNVIRAEILHQWNQWQEGQTFIVEAEHQRKDGTIYPVEVSTGVVRCGKRNFILAIVKDITERKRAEEELKESEEKFAKVFHDAPVWIAITDMTDSTYLDVNDQALQVSGFTREEVIGHTSIEIGWISADDRARLIQEINDHGRITGFEMKFRAKDGRTLFGWVSGELIVIGGRSCLLTVTVDITERRRTEEELRESEKRFSILSEAAFDGIVISEKGRIIEVNEQLAAMFGYERLEMIGTEVGKFVAPESLELVMQHMLSGSERPYEHLSLRKNGSTFPVEIRAKSLPYKGRVVRVTAIRDITERKRVEEELRQMQKLEGLGTLAGGIAHDFNNILGIILAYNTNIKRVKNDTKKLDLATETITKAVERGKTLVQQVLTFARKTDVTFGPVNVNDVVMEIITMIYETFPRIVTCSQNFDKTIPCITADHTQLYQALLNLCVNARDAMPKGGILSINTSMTSVESLRNYHPEAAASSYICIEISDTGEGMTEEVRKHIFEPFFTTKGIGKGTGLGLSVTFGVIQSHKGFIDVESELGRGTTFRLYLPVTQVAVTIEVKDEETLDEIPGGTETLLVVEDEEMLMASLQMVLVEKGYNVLTAGDGLTGLNIYQENKNDIALVITDLGLPNITGLEVCQRIKTINPNEHLILATGFLDPNMKLEFIEAGIRHFLYKPYDLREVLKVVREVLDKK